MKKEIAPLTVLMSVYLRDDSRIFRQALLSNTTHQCALPQAFVLVIDGDLTGDLDAVVSDFECICKGAGIDLLVLRNKVNRGLAFCLNAGLNICPTELVARADADDISSPDRFEKQIKALKRLDCNVVFSYQNEYVDDWNVIKSLKVSPVDHLAIKRALYMRCVVPHSCVLYRKSDVLGLGGYSESVGLLEDYDLHLRMISAGYKYSCVPEPLINVRVTTDQRVRRGGLKFAFRELKVRTYWFLSGFLPVKYYLAFSVPYFVFRASPASVKEFFYKLVRK